MRTARKLLILGAMSRTPPWAALAAACASALLGLGAGGCLTAQDAGAEAPDMLGTCSVAADCVLAAPSCCACPSYALPIGSGFADACDGVECPSPPLGCAPLVARCDEGACVAACMPAACELSCPTGFAADASGCLACACAPTPAGECAVDTDCERVPADCCGCERGGQDTAVPAVRAGEHLADLMCGGTESCPGVSTCDGAEPRCQLGRCVLAAPITDPGGPPGACGRPDLPPCPPGEACVLNESDEAGPLGVGVCRPTP